MTIRRMTPDDVHAASAVCLDAFTVAVAPTLSAQGIATFAGVASAAAFAIRLQGDNILLVAVDAGAIRGVAELKEGRHVAMLFVAPDGQQRGIGRALMTALLAHARAPLITVSASLTSVPAYARYGFVCAGEVATASGLVYQPMHKPHDVAAPVE
ncbi:GNAT family N-acetyltransferase [Stenotrophomonas sp. LGBM10]|uniref:GNAT family N-acetyltransferase n=1 Tax=Stenotrophomonas sp. LGBM10 TaxID=3390038 RepID=UPI00398B079D